MTPAVPPDPDFHRYRLGRQRARRQRIQVELTNRGYATRAELAALFPDLLRQLMHNLLHDMQRDGDITGERQGDTLVYYPTRVVRARGASSESPWSRRAK